jgi:hypothetical protein
LIAEGELDVYIEANVMSYVILPKAGKIVESFGVFWQLGQITLMILDEDAVMSLPNIHF